MADARHPQAHVIAITALALALMASWAWFFHTQQRMDAQLAMLAAKAGNKGGGASGKAAGDPYKDEAVKNTIRKQAPDIQKLWLSHLAQQPTLTEGTVEVDWQIDANGEVRQAALVHSDFADAALGQGVLKVLQATRFPPPPGGVPTYMAHTFKFKKD
jgi:TonB family protein